MLIPGAPLGLITTSVQALAGLLLPSASVFLLLLCNDREVLGPWVNPKWLNVVAAVIISMLLVLSGTLMATTLFPSIDVAKVFVWLAIALAVVGAGILVALRVLRPRGALRAPPSPPAMAEVEKMSWRMPPLTLLKPVKWSPGLRIGILALRGLPDRQRHPAAGEGDPARRG